MSTKVPPNGGWGWMIALAGALNGISTISILQGFGLVFKDSFVKFNLNATDTSIIINVNLAFGMLLGLINGPLLKIYGYRKIAIIGSTLFSVGIIMTSFANTFILIMFWYGVLASIGLSMTLSAFSLALNSYFTTRRERAVGLTITITGLGPIFMPQVTSFLLSYYGIQGTILLFGAYSLHSMLGAFLLQPIKWHMKNAPLCLETITKNPDILIDDDTEKINNKAETEADIYSSRLTINNCQRKRKTTISSIDHDVEVGSIYGFDTPLPRRMSINRSVSHDINYGTEMSVIKNISMTNLHDSRNHLYSNHPWWNSAKSVDSVNLGSSIKIFDEPAPITKKVTLIDNNGVNSNSISQNVMEKDSLLEKETGNCSTEKNYDNENNKNKSAIRRILRRVADLYDFDLLRDPIYVNIMLGMSIAIFAEANFSMLTPFILADTGMTTAKIANIMSVIAVADLISRGAAPYLGECLHQPSRMMYMFSLCLLIISRFSLLFANNYASLLATAIGLGAAKGIRSVYMALVVPSYVPIQKLPNASGIQMLTNGIILICVGPMLGIIRDFTGSYSGCIIFINCVTAITVCIWTIELIILRRRNARRKSELPETPH